MNVLLPAMFGPVMSQNRPVVRAEQHVVGTNVPGGSVWSRTGCRPSRMSRTGSSTSTGRT